jgi:ketosteroid isomerase-like protein
MVPRCSILKIPPLIAIVFALSMPAIADDYSDMVNAEKAFAADASARNTRDAFLAALADDGIVFAPGPTHGKHSWESRPINDNRLEWTPAVAEIAASGDLGFTSGPWRFTAKGADKPVAFGHFFTIWKKQPDGKWKVLVDHGVSHVMAPFPDKVVRRGGIGVGKAPTWPVGMAELRSADLAPVGALNPRMVSADFFRLREGQLPDGRAEGDAFASTAARVDTGQVISAAGDLAATWGGGVGGPSWIRVWRRPSAEDAPGKGWQLAAELALPPPPKPED